MRHIDQQLITRLRRPHVYIWRRGTEVLYVGATMNLMGRLGNHNIIGKRESFQPSDVIEIFECSTSKQLDRLERAFIEAYQPKYNVAGMPLDLQRSRRKSMKRAPLKGNVELVDEGLVPAPIVKRAWRVGQTNGR